MPLEQFERQVINKHAKQEATAGVENFRDEDDNPFGQLMEDLMEEIRLEAEKCQKHEDKKNSEESLVAGGETLCD